MCLLPTIIQNACSFIFVFAVFYENRGTQGQSLSAAVPKQWIANRRAGLSYKIDRVRVINQQLCCCGSDGVVVLDRSGLNRVGLIAVGLMESVYDVAEMCDEDIVIAAKTGLFHANGNGKKQSS